jgi:uncharacterized membrane protein
MRMSLPRLTFPRFLYSVLIIAVICHLLVIWALPRVIMTRVMSVLPGQVGAGGVTLADRPDDKARQIVMPSPDLLYAPCTFNLADGPVRFTADVPQTYWSLSLFAANTDNFFVLNGDAAPDHADIILAAPDGPVPNAPPGVLVVPAPSLKGVALYRFLVANDGDLDRVKAFQKTATCKKF